MCHGYEMTWWKSETTARKKIKEANSDVIRKLAARPDEKAEPVAEEKVEDKELIPAE